MSNPENGPRFDTRTFLKAHWPKTPALVAFLKSYNVHVEQAAVYKWAGRGTVPSSHFPLLLAFLEIEQGQPVSLVPYIKG